MPLIILQTHLPLNSLDIYSFICLGQAKQVVILSLWISHGYFWKKFARSQHDSRCLLIRWLYWLALSLKLKYWLPAAKIGIKTHMVGNMNEGDAFAYFKGKLQATSLTSSVDLSEKTAGQIHQICGGNPGLINDLIQRIDISEELEPGETCLTKAVIHVNVFRQSILAYSI